MKQFPASVRVFAQAVSEVLCNSHLGLSSPAQRKLNDAARGVIAAAEVHEKMIDALTGGEPGELSSGVNLVDADAFDALAEDYDATKAAVLALNENLTAVTTSVLEALTPTQLDERLAAFREQLLAEIAKAAPKGKAPADTPPASPPAPPAPAAA